MRDYTFDTIAPGATQEQFFRAVEKTPVGYLNYHGPFLVHQSSPQVRTLDAELRFERRHTAALAELLSGTDERVKGTFRFHLKPDPLIMVYNDYVYHPYHDYARCIVAMASLLADTDFSLCLRHESDNGDWSFLVDRYRITDGKLQWLRTQTPYDDLDSYLLSVDAP
ncbi:hypothetical protein [Kitasatospora sp. NPDC005856]|uniref:hypothetical protein n=1 Tax=Kitasatospora sp. NPDC005856 TaxID=3154566 RepID=UPI0033F269E7